MPDLAITITASVVDFNRALKELASSIGIAVSVFRELDATLNGYPQKPYGPLWQHMAKLYAAQYNASHPNRKLSWRRLNRPQRQEVAAAIMRVDRKRLPSRFPTEDREDFTSRVADMTAALRRSAERIP